MKVCNGITRVTLPMRSALVLFSRGRCVFLIDVRFSGSFIYLAAESFARCFVMKDCLRK